MNAQVAESEDQPRRYLVFALDDRRLAVDLEQAVRVIHSVAVEPVDEAPAAVAGFVDLRGEKVPAIDMRRRLAMPERRLALSDQLVLVQRGVWRAFLIVDDVVAVAELGRPTKRQSADPRDCCSAEIHHEDGVISLLDLARLLTSAESQQVRRLLARGDSP